MSAMSWPLRCGSRRESAQIEPGNRPCPFEHLQAGFAGFRFQTLHALRTMELTLPEFRRKPPLAKNSGVEPTAKTRSCRSRNLPPHEPERRAPSRRGLKTKLQQAETVLGAPFWLGSGVQSAKKVFGEFSPRGTPATWEAAGGICRRRRPVEGRMSGND